MQKEKILKNIILISILSIILIAHYNYDGQTNNADIRNYGTETVMINNPVEHYSNDSLVLLPPDWLLTLNNISVNKSF